MDNTTMKKPYKPTVAEQIEIGLRKENQKQRRNALNLDVLIQRMSTRQEYETWLDQVRDPASLCTDHDQLNKEPEIK